jgi:hypothetical protein
MISVPSSRVPLFVGVSNGFAILLQTFYYCWLDSGPNGHGLSKLLVSEL